MKIFAFTDNHADLDSISVVASSAKDVDLFVCLGDITWFGQGMIEMLEAINNLPKPVILLHGNHEYLPELQETAKKFKNITVTHKEMHIIGEYTFLSFGGDGFSRRDPEFEKAAEKFKKKITNNKKTILLLHGPPFETNLDVPFANYHSGSESYRTFIEEVQPCLVLCGHIHECEGVSDYINDSLVMNPGIYGERIDLDDLPKKV